MVYAFQSCGVYAGKCVCEREREKERTDPHMVTHTAVSVHSA